MIAKRTTYRIAATLFTLSLTLLASLLIARYIPRKIALTPEEREWLQENTGKITIGGDPSYPPIDFVNERGERDGISEDVLALVEKRLGFTFRRAYPEDWTTALESVRGGKMDMLTAVSPTATRDGYLELTASYIEAPTVFVILASNKAIKKVSDLAGKRVSITKNYSSFAYFSEHNPGFTIIEAENDFAGLMEVATGEVDAALSDIPVISYFVGEKNISNLKILAESGYTHELAIGVRKDMPILCGIMDKALASISAHDRQRIIERWIGLEFRNALYESRTWIVLTAIISGVTALLLFAGLWDKSLRMLVRVRTRELVAYKGHLEELVAARTRELEEANRALEVLARTDTLTGCSNRRSFLEAAEREHGRFLRYGTPYSLVEFDLDHFKQINDRYGHAAGDRVLKKAAGLIMARLRANDTLARVGGEEFFALLPDTSMNESFETAERLRQALEDGGTERTETECPCCTASFGVACAQRGDADFEVVMSRADAALYRAKEEGRNRTERG